jgi:hypothetical protein
MTRSLLHAPRHARDVLSLTLSFRAQAVISWKLKDEYGTKCEDLDKAIREALGTRRGDGQKFAPSL